MNDIIIIGGGPAGLTAAIYSARAGMDTVLFEKAFPGGQMSTTDKIENYPGIESVNGIDLALSMEKQAKAFGANIINEEVISIEFDQIKKVVKTKNKTYIAKAIILAMGASPKELGVEGENRLRGSGVSYCATCDGAFFKGKTVAVAGGGNVAVEEALFLSKLCEKVYLIHRRDSFRAEKVLQDAVVSAPNVQLILSSTIEEIKGKFNVEEITVKNVNTSKVSNLAVDGVFVAIGTKPNSGLVTKLLETTSSGYIHSDNTLQTNIFGVFVAGDVREKSVRQVVVASADGVIATQSAIKYINEHRWA